MGYDVRFIQSDRFQVKDRAAFESWLEETAEESLKRFWNDEGVMFNMVDGDNCGLRFLTTESEKYPYGEVETNDFLGGLVEHLAEGESAAILVMGFERDSNSSGDYINYAYATRYEATPEGFKEAGSLDV